MVRLVHNVRRESWWNTILFNINIYKSIWRRIAVWCGLLMTSDLGFKSRIDIHLCALLPACNRIPIFISGVTTPNLLADSMTANWNQSINLQTSICGVQVWDFSWCCLTKKYKNKIKISRSESFTGWFLRRVQVNVQKLIIFQKKKTENPSKPIFLKLSLKPWLRF